MARGAAGCVGLLCALAAAQVGATEALPPEALAFVARWVATQNDGDFPAYSALYASTFRGVRRSGDRAVVLDRAGWLRDRQRMFKKKMQVTVDHVAVVRLPNAFEIQLTQTFRSGSYADVGQKRLVIAKDGGAYRITAEEMLESQLTTLSPEQEVAKKMRQLREALDHHDQSVLRSMLPPKGRFETELQVCAGDGCTPSIERHSWTRATVWERAFESASLGDECVADVTCERDTCTAGCGGCQGSFEWTRVDASFYLVALRADCD
jgi:hypothetical protein